MACWTISAWRWASEENDCAMKLPPAESASASGLTGCCFVPSGLVAVSKSSREVGEDFETSTSPEGTKQQPVNPLALALSAGGTFIAQSFSSDSQRHTEIVQKAIEHDGFGFVNVYSPCVTFNDVDTYDYFRDTIVDLDETDHDPNDYDDAKEKILDADKEYQGVIYQDESSVGFEEREGITESMADIPEGAPEDAMDLVREFY